MTKRIKSIIVLALIFIAGAAVGAGIIMIKDKMFWDGEDKKLTEYYARKQSQIDSGVYSLSEGNFYLNGDKRNAYWQVDSNTIRLVADDDQLLTYYYARCADVERSSASVSGTMSGNTDFTNVPDYEKRINKLKAYTEESADYIFDVTNSSSVRSGVQICAEVLDCEDWEKQYIYDKEGGIFMGGVYINENVFELDGCVWVRRD